MPRITRPLSPTEIKAAKPKEKEYTLCDGAGLELVIKPNGSKLWRLRYYRPLTKQRNMISFGSWPEMSLAEAREKRSEAKSLLLQSIDPQHVPAWNEEVQKPAQRKALRVFCCP
ncbi:integrase arm-type DNA-binding domain-containing protein [Aeromonas encheleia]|uniref:Integrase arm-type DNA-binding domain-containing protein n=1 Tax=Aeromonas encheleia TaxID=73010 RepID=A0AAE9SET1_9GAMM|nr:integrase arm-type DNA-binding domain-containing protein [Aeromonas encheleia]USV58762.1 integrase arm-type DNA-binding domain-containing protein [Aeromonas encheleia]